MGIRREALYRVASIFMVDRTDKASRTEGVERADGADELTCGASCTITCYVHSNKTIA